MKTKIEKLTTEKVFEPFQLSINVESLDELKMLWCRFNLPEKTIIEENLKEDDRTKDVCSYKVGDSSFHVFMELDGILLEYLLWVIYLT